MAVAILAGMSVTSRLVGLVVGMWQSVLFTWHLWLPLFPESGSLLAGVSVVQEGCGRVL